MPQKIYFPSNDPLWEFDRDCVRFYAVIDHRTVICRISAEALMAYFGASSFDAGEAIRSFQANREAIQEATRRKLEVEEAKNPGVREIMLADADFRSTATTTTTPAPHPRLMTRLMPEVANDPVLFAVVKSADAILEESLVRGGTRISVTWSAVPVLGGTPLLKLALVEEETGATVFGLFTREDLRGEAYARFALFRLWDDLLKERGRKLLQFSHSSSVEEE